MFVLHVHIPNILGRNDFTRKDISPALFRSYFGCGLYREEIYAAGGSEISRYKNQSIFFNCKHQYPAKLCKINLNAHVNNFKIF